MLALFSFNASALYKDPDTSAPSPLYSTWQEACLVGYGGSYQAYWSYSTNKCISSGGYVRKPEKYWVDGSCPEGTTQGTDEFGYAGCVAPQIASECEGKPETVVHSLEVVINGSTTIYIGESTISNDGCLYSTSETFCTDSKRYFLNDDPTNLFCDVTFTNTGLQAAVGDTPYLEYDPNISYPSSLEDHSNLSSVTQPLQTYPDQPAIGDLTEVESTTESVSYPPEGNLATGSETTTLTLKGGYSVSKTTTSTNKALSDGTVIEEIQVSYDQTTQTNKIISYTGNSTEPTESINQVEGYNSVETTITTTNPDGSSTVSSSITGGGTVSDSPNEESANSVFSQESLDTTAQDQGILDLQGMIDGLGTEDLSSIENHPLFTSVNPFDSFGGVCQSVTIDFWGNDYVFPGTDGCYLFDQAKTIMAWFLWGLLVITGFELATRKAT